MDSSVITIQQVAASLCRVCEAHPTIGPDYHLHPDASLLSELYGSMIYSKVIETCLADLSEPMRAAVDRWNTGDRISV